MTTVEARIQKLSRLLEYLWDCVLADEPVVLEAKDTKFLRTVTSSRNEPDGFSVTFDDGTLLDVVVIEGFGRVDLS